MHTAALFISVNVPNIDSIQLHLWVSVSTSIQRILSNNALILIVFQILISFLNIIDLQWFNQVKKYWWMMTPRLPRLKDKSGVENHACWKVTLFEISPTIRWYHNKTPSFANKEASTKHSDKTPPRYEKGCRQEQRKMPLFSERAEYRRKRVSMEGEVEGVGLRSFSEPFLLLIILWCYPYFLKRRDS